MEEKQKKKIKPGRDIMKNIVNIKTLIDILAAKGIIKDQQEWDFFKEQTLREMKEVYEFKKKE